MTSLVLPFFVFFRVQQTDSIPGFAVQYGPIHFVGAQRLLLDYSDVEPTAGSESPDAQGTLTAQVSYHMMSLNGYEAFFSMSLK